MPRPRSLTPDRIAAAALAVIDRAGLGGLTMRAVAKELGMATMSLYRYVADRDELEALVVEQVLAGVDLAVPPGDWQSRLAELVSRLWDAVVSHAAIVPLLVRHRHVAPTSLAWIEAMLTVLTEAGFTGERRVIAQRTVASYLIGTLQGEHHGPLAGAGTAAMAAQERYPLLAQTASTARKVPPAAEFRGGLEIVLRGLGAG